jgi:hypothetical protein
MIYKPGNQNWNKTAGRFLPLLLKEIQKQLIKKGQMMRLAHLSDVFKGIFIINPLVGKQFTNPSNRL